MAEKASGARTLAARILFSCGIVVFLLLLCVFFQIMTGGRFLSGANLENILRQTSVNMILGVGMTLVIIAGGIDLSVGSVLALADTLCARRQITLDSPSRGRVYFWVPVVVLAVGITLLVLIK